MRLHRLSFAVLFAVARPLDAQDPLADARKALEYVDATVFSPAMTYRIRMTTYKDDAADKAYLMRVAKLGERLRIEFDEPAVEKGRRMLNDGDALWMYLAHTGKTVRLANRQAFMGSDASNQDLMRLSLRDDYTLTGAAPDSIAGEHLLRLDLAAKNGGVAYDRVRLYVNPATHFPRFEEFITVSGKLLKRMVFSEPRTAGGAPFPTRVVITNELMKNTRTVLEYSDVARAPNLSAAFFTQASLRR
jgi:outer membrane lipoprotein-sorting protein